MILAELHSKIPSKLEHKEDLLTSNVFSFFKYSNRNYLKEYLSALGILVSLTDAENAEFEFWPSYEDGTEPDLVIICGDYYLLFEAKLFSDFSEKIIDIETKEIEVQLEREARMGLLSSKNLNKTLILIAITSEYYKKNKHYQKIINPDYKFIWTNWQFVARFLLTKIEDPTNNQDQYFLNDLYRLLLEKKLRSFRNFNELKPKKNIHPHKIIFYDQKTSMFKGEFTGFIDTAIDFDPIGLCPAIYKRKFFKLKAEIIHPINTKIFYNGTFKH